MKKTKITLGLLIISIIGYSQIGIGTKNPQSTLDVIGRTRTTNLQVTSGASAGRILTSDAAGNATWQAPISVNTSSWYNASTTIPANSNTASIYQNGNVGIRTSNPQYPLDVNGVSRMNNNVVMSGLPSSTNQRYAAVVSDANGNLYKREITDSTINSFQGSANGGDVVMNEYSVVLWQASGAGFNLNWPGERLGRIIYLVCASGNQTGNNNGVSTQGCKVNYNIHYANGIITDVIPNGRRATIIGVNFAGGVSWYIIEKDF